MINDLLLLSGIDIPFIDAQINIHQPKIKEIAYIGEDAFFTGCSLLNFSKDMLNTEDKISLENKTNFEVFMSIMRDKNTTLKKNRVSVMMVLALLFPDYNIQLVDNGIALIKKDEPPHFISKLNFEEFKSILIDMFCLNKKNKDDLTYNPQSRKAKEIAEKLMRGRKRAAELKGEDPEKVAVLSRYVSILAVGESKSIDSLLQYTVYQLFDEFERFNLKTDFDAYFQMKLVGAKDLEEVENWMKDIHKKGI